MSILYDVFLQKSLIISWSVMVEYIKNNYKLKDILGTILFSLIGLKILLHLAYIVIYKPKLNLGFGLGKNTIVSYLINLNYVQIDKNNTLIKTINKVITIIYIYIALTLILVFVKVKIKDSAWRSIFHNVSVYSNVTLQKCNAFYCFSSYGIGLGY